MADIEKVTHDALVNRAFMWLKNKRRCSIVVSEITAGGGEIPDVIGWHGFGSTVIEAKVSVADFRKDQLKSFRRYPENGMGMERYYIVPSYISDVIGFLPDKWGLLVCSGRGVVTVVKKSEYFDCDKNGELLTLISLIRRIARTDKPLAGVGVKYYTEFEGASKNPRSTLFVEPEVEVTA